MASKLEHPVVRRLKDGTPAYKIVELGLCPGDEEKLTVSARNPRQDPKEGEMALTQALTQLFPWLDPQNDRPTTPSDASDQDPVGMSGTVDATELESQLMVDDLLAPFALRVRIWNLVRAIQEDRDPEYGRYGTSCQVFELEEGLDLTHLEVQLSEFKLVFARYGQHLTVSIGRDFREVLDDRQMAQLAEFSARSVEVLNKYGVKAVADGQGVDQLEKLAKEHGLLGG